VLKVLKVPQELRVYLKEQPEGKVFKVHKEQLVRLVFHKVQLDHKEPRELLDKQGRLVV